MKWTLDPLFDLPASASIATVAARSEHERDLYLRLLELGHQKELRPLLEEALKLAVEATGAERGYIEIYSDRDPASGPQWSMARGCSDEEVAEIRAVTSRGIAGAAMAKGETIHTPYALLDPRFSERASVRDQRLEAVLCAPIGGNEPIGVLYLQGQRGKGPFADADIILIERFAKHIAPFMQRLLAQSLLEKAHDQTAPWRQKLQCATLIGRSAAIAKALQHASLVAPLDVSALLTGESGTGKTQLARVIHENSPRRGGPFVELNCATIPESLIENELFGSEAGAHSTANVRREGKIAAAEGGTLFLDEVGELPLGAQAKLLQVLQSREYYPLGATKPVHANARVIAATNADLSVLARERKFREDLYYRLHVIPIKMPPLRERSEDIRLLAEHFADEISIFHSLPRATLSASACIALETSEWQGNVRQLRNAIEVALIRAAQEGSPQIETRHIFEDTAAVESRPAGVTFFDGTRRYQRGLVEQTLSSTNWNVMESARRLDITRSHLYNLIRGFGLTRRDS